MIRPKKTPELSFLTFSQITFKIPVLMLFFISIIIFSFQSCSKKHVDKKWSNRLIPLPQKISINGSALIPAGQIQLKLPETDHPVFTTINEILAPVPGGGEGSNFAISFIYASSDECPGPLRKVLEELPNSDQAYSIEMHLEDGAFTGLTVIGNSPVGLLYGARTLAQLLGTPSDENKFEIPKVSIVDWPYLAERGEWGWNLPNDKESIAELKMNHIEFHSDLGFNSDGSPRASINLETLEQAKKIGVKVVPIIRHMEANALTDSSEKAQAIQTSLEKMDDAAGSISASINKWGALVNPNPRKRFQSRFRDTVGFGQSTADILRQRAVPAKELSL